jgi:hypothetical protein
MEQPVLLTVQAEQRGDELKLRARSVELLSDVRARATREVCFQLNLSELNKERLQRLRALLKEQRGGCSTTIKVRAVGRFEVEFELPEHPVSPTSLLEEDAAVLFGRQDVVVLS